MSERIPPRSDRTGDAPAANHRQWYAFFLLALVLFATVVLEVLGLIATKGLASFLGTTTAFALTVVAAAFGLRCSLAGPPAGARRVPLAMALMAFPTAALLGSLGHHFSSAQSSWGGQVGGDFVHLLAGIAGQDYTFVPVLIYAAGAFAVAVLALKLVRESQAAGQLSTPAGSPSMGGHHHPNNPSFGQGATAMNESDDEGATAVAEMPAPAPRPSTARRSSIADPVPYVPTARDPDISVNPPEIVRSSREPEPYFRPAKTEFSESESAATAVMEAEPATETTAEAPETDFEQDSDPLSDLPAFLLASGASTDASDEQDADLEPFGFVGADSYEAESARFAETTATIAEPAEETATEPEDEPDAALLDLESEVSDAAPFLSDDDGQAALQEQVALAAFSEPVAEKPWAEGLDLDAADSAPEDEAPGAADLSQLAELEPERDQVAEAVPAAFPAEESAVSAPLEDAIEAESSEREAPEAAADEDPWNGFEAETGLFDEVEEIDADAASALEEEEAPVAREAAPADPAPESASETQEASVDSDGTEATEEAPDSDRNAANSDTLFAHRSEIDEEIYVRAVGIVTDANRCSVAMLQRSLEVSFSEATALIERMYDEGVVGPQLPSGRRKILAKKRARSATKKS